MQRVEIQMEAVDACDPDASRVVREIEISDPDRVWRTRKDQAGDARIVGPSAIELRAERSGYGNSHNYTVHFECADTTADIGLVRSLEPTREVHLEQESAIGWLDRLRA
jgi:hypothetical protein